MVASASSWRTLDEAISSHATTKPGDIAYIEPTRRMSWLAYDGYITLAARRLLASGLAPGDRVGVWLKDGVAVHVALNACLRAGVVPVGIGARSGALEMGHLLGTTGARALLTESEHRGIETATTFARLQTDLPDLSLLLHIEETMPLHQGAILEAAEPDEIEAARQEIAGHHRDPHGLCLINSTSGTTGLPKCVAHSERRWIRYHDYAVDAGDLISSDICMSVIPAPFGFGLWTSHFTPTLLGVPVVVMPKFDPIGMLELMHNERVTVLMAVTTQFIMMLGVPNLERYDLSALRVLFTGGEAIPYDKGVEFEQRTGAMVLNMYGSNETGVQSYTTLRDSKEHRLRSAGKVVPELDVRLFDQVGNQIDRSEGPGQPGSKGEVCSLGYYGDEAANHQLFTGGGWMLMGDLVTIDDQGYLRVVGRTSDFIIRGGKNISAAAVEAEVSSHPAVLKCAAVAMPDDVFGERVCVYVEVRRGATVALGDLVAHLTARGVSREWLPERLVVVDALPISDGGKVAKAVLRSDIRQRLILDNSEPLGDDPTDNSHIRRTGDSE